MTATEYLRNRLTTCASCALSDADRAFIASDGIEAFIYKALTNKRFRKWAIDEATQLHVRAAIRLAVTAGKPIRLTFPFGGYKLWRLPSSPEVDWSEFFMLSYYLSYMAPVAAAYTPGIMLSFSSDDIIVERMNNIPDADTDAYARSFNALLDRFRTHLPPNITIELRRVRDMYPDRSVYERELAENVIRFEKEFKLLDPVILAEKEKSSMLNIRWDGARDLTGLTDAEQRNMVRHGTILHDATCFVLKRVAFVRDAEKIVIFSNKVRECIPIGTTKSSRTKFWTGFGVLERRDNGFLDRILSPEQYEKMKTVEHEIVPTDLVPLKNFSEISVYSRQFDFSQ